jgi:uncharacterized membrane protein YkoI
MKQRPPFLALAPMLASVVACASAPAAPPQLVELYDAATPDGMLEIELDRDGSFREMEAEIAVDDVPAHILAAARKLAPGGLVTGAEREHTQMGSGYEVKMSHDGRDWEFVFDADGELIETEKQVFAREAPEAVMRASEEAMPGSTLKSVEIITRGENVAYHVKRAQDGASYKLVISREGELLRHVREAKAEIEIPLR